MVHSSSEENVSREWGYWPHQPSLVTSYEDLDSKFIYLFLPISESVFFFLLSLYAMTSS